MQAESVRVFAFCPPSAYLVVFVRKRRRVRRVFLVFLFPNRHTNIKRDWVAARNISNFGLNKFCHFYEKFEFFLCSTSSSYWRKGYCMRQFRHLTGISWEVAGIWDIPSRCFVVNIRGDEGESSIFLLLAAASSWYRRGDGDWRWRWRRKGGILLFSFLSGSTTTMVVTCRHNWAAGCW